MMVDPRATHNFISNVSTHKLGLSVISSKLFGMSLGNEETVQGEGEYRAVHLELQGITIVEGFLPISLVNSDIILGIQWLEKLGTITSN